MSPFTPVARALEELQSPVVDVVDLCQLWELVEHCALSSLGARELLLGPVPRRCDARTLVALHLRVVSLADNPHLSRVLEDTLLELLPHLAAVLRLAPELGEIGPFVAALEAGEIAASRELLTRRIGQIRDAAFDVLSA